MQNDFARYCVFNANRAELTRNLVTIGDVPELAGHFIRECVAMCEDWKRELARKLSKNAMVIGIRHNDSRNTAGSDQFGKRFAPQRNWIDKVSAVRSPEASRVKIRFNGTIITVPNAEIRMIRSKSDAGLTRETIGGQRAPLKLAQVQRGCLSHRAIGLSRRLCQTLDNSGPVLAAASIATSSQLY